MNNALSETSVEGSQTSAADDQVNKSGRKEKGSKDGTVTRDVIALSAASMVYSLITSVLHKARDACRLQIFHDLFYVFSTWSQFKSKISQNTLKVSWYERASGGFDLSRGVPEVSEVRVQDRLYGNSEVEDVSGENCRLLVELMKQHPEMCLVVEHEVTVKGIKTPKPLRYFVNLIEVVSKMLGAFSCVESNCSPEEILSVDKDALKVVYVISTALRNIIDETLKTVKANEPVPWVSKKKKADKNQHVQVEDNTGEFTFPLVQSLSVENFMPAWSRQRDHLVSMLLTLKQPEYKVKHRPTGVNTVGTDDPMPLNDDAEDFNDTIQPDEALGTMEF